MLTQDKPKAMSMATERDSLRRELLRLILKNEARRKAEAKTAQSA
jgi:hypothetical protein